VQYFDISTIKAAIEHLQNYSANWLLPAFVFAANDIGQGTMVDMSKAKGTDRFLDRYFNGTLLDLPPMPRGNNLLRPRFSDITWKRGDYAGDYMIRQDTKMWGNLFSSRGYREMAQRGYIEGEKAIIMLTDTFQEEFENQIPDTFRFENFMVWLFAFRGFPDEVDGWVALYHHLLSDELGLTELKPEYRGRFSLADPTLPWPATLSERPSNEVLIAQLAPKLSAMLATPTPEEEAADDLPALPDDDQIYTDMMTAIRLKESFSFLLAGPPGTGKSRYARRLATKIAEVSERILFLQFHPALGYDDFVEGFRPTKSKDASGKETEGVTYELARRLFMKFAEKAGGEPNKKFVAVIDELNRGDVARIFGEVLTYLEPAYREKNFTLAYSGNEVSLPSNLVVIATANPYDRSVTELDDALLRRFWVFELEPDAAILRFHLTDSGVDPGLVNRTVQLFNLVHTAMPNGFGHTNFLRVRTLEDLVSVWTGRIRMGLRRAYFHDNATFKTTEAAIEALLTVNEDVNAGPAEEAPAAAAPET
jgi:MoxR-like ATPase